MSATKKPSLDNLFGGEECVHPTGNCISEISLNLIDPYPDNPYRLYSGPAKEDLIEDIRNNGVINPVILRSQGNGRYTTLAGHNRIMCAKLASLSTVPSIVKENISDGESKLIVVHSNNQRGFTELLPSERAFSLKLELEGLKAERRDMQRVKAIEESESYDSAGVFQMEHSGKSRDVLAQKYDLKPTDIQRIVSLTKLCRNLLDLVDNKEIFFRAALPLTVLPSDFQETIFKIIKSENGKLDVQSATEIKKVFTENHLTENNLRSILCGAPEQPALKAQKREIKVKAKVIDKYFPKAGKEEEIVKRIEQALELQEVTIPRLVQFYMPQASPAEYESILEKAMQLYLTTESQCQKTG